MAVINLPTGLENLGADMGQLGQALAKTFFPGTIKDAETEALIRARPEIGASMAQAVRRGGPGALTAAGVSPRLESQIEQMFPAGMEEQIHSAIMNDPLAMQRFTEAFRQRPEVEIAQGGATIAQSEMTVEQIGHLREQDVPRLTAMVQSGQLQQAGQELAHVERLGLIEKRLINELRVMNNQEALDNFQLDRMQDYLDFVHTLPAHLRGVAAAGMVNPALSNHILAHEQMGFEERMTKLRMAAQTGDAGLTFMEAWKVQGDLRDRVNNAADRLRAANESGNERDRVAAVADLNNLASTNRNLIEQGIIPAGSVIDAEMRTRFIRSGLGDLFTEEPQFNLNWVNQSMERYNQMLAAGAFQPYVDAGMPIPHPTTFLQQSPGWIGLSKANQAKVLADIEAGRPPTLLAEPEGREVRPTPANSNGGNAQGGTAPQARQTRAQIAARIAEIERIPRGQRTPEHTTELIRLRDSMIFAPSGNTSPGRGPGGR